jgi:hypothetical protein
METKIKSSLKKVHIGTNVWSCGKINENYKGTKIKHMVIYGPNNSQYQIFDKDVEFITTIDEVEYGDLHGLHKGYCNRNGNYSIESKLKIFILTAILDQQTQWRFNLKKRPKSGKLKVIYENGTIKNIDFNGEFKPVEIPYFWSKSKKSTRLVNVFGYRLPKSMNV